jgi:uncharacterized RDD family membrane protein YckC
MTVMNDQHPQVTRLGQYAGFATRLVAFTIDRLIVAGTTTIVVAVTNLVLEALGLDELLDLSGQGSLIMPVFVAVITLLIPITYDIGFWLLAGQTPGKRAMGLRIVRTDGQRLTPGNCVRRIIGYWISAILFLGYLWVLVDNRRQGFHDKIAGTFVVYAWPEVGPPVTPARDRLGDLRQRREAARDQD